MLSNLHINYHNHTLTALLRSNIEVIPNRDQLFNYFFFKYLLKMGVRDTPENVRVLIIILIISSKKV